MEAIGSPRLVILSPFWRLLRAVYFKLRKSIGKRTINSLLKRGKLASEAFTEFLAFHGGDVNGFYAMFSCRYVDNSPAFYSPKEIEFSCSNTPNYPSFHSSSNKRRNRHRNNKHSYIKYSIAAVAKEFEHYNSVAHDSENINKNVAFFSASPSLVPIWLCGKSPVAVRQVRITDSPFPIVDEEAAGTICVDKEAEDFIRRFYEQLTLQKFVVASPEIGHGRRGGAVYGRC